MSALLQVRGIETFYGARQALFGVSLDVNEGEFVTRIGRNGMGKIWRCLDRLKQTGLSLIVIDKNIGPLMRLTDRHFILEKGRVVWNGDSHDLRRESGLLHEYVGV